MNEQKKLRACLGEGILAADCLKAFKTTKNRRICKRCTVILGTRYTIADYYHLGAKRDTKQGPMANRAINGWVKPVRGAE